LRYGDKFTIETTYHPCVAAKLNFSYRLLNASNGDVVLTATTMQVFLASDTFALQLTNPPFLEEWKKKFDMC
jgi:acyl-CoA thioester hydrolase